MSAERADASQRGGSLLDLLRKRGLEAAILFDLKNIRYLLGFTGSDGVAVIGLDEPCLLVDGRYTAQAKVESPRAVVYEYTDKIEGISKLLAGRGLRKVGFEAGAVSHDFFLKLRKKNGGLCFSALSPQQTGNLRAVKENDEINRIKTAIAIAEEAFVGVIAAMKPGVSERDIAIELDYRMRKGGAEGPSFNTITASGPNSSLPHSRPGERRLERNDVVVIDWGAVFDGYHSDETCTLVLGRGSDDFKKAYDLIKEAHDRAIESLRPGVPFAEVDRRAREWIERGGRGPLFSHGTGHGIGLDIHESPRLAASSVGILQEGMVVTVEPGIYLPGKWGIRIEDTVLVTGNGPQVLTKIDKGWAIN